jgi:ribosomal protein L39E
MAKRKRTKDKPLLTQKTKQNRTIWTTGCEIR